MEILHFIVPSIIKSETTSTQQRHMRWQMLQLQVDGPLKGLHAMLDEVEYETLNNQRSKLGSFVVNIIYNIIYIQAAI